MKQTLRPLDSFHRSHGDNNNPKTNTSNNSDEPIQEDASTSRSNNNVSPARDKDHACDRKQSVLTKVKEKAKTWGQTLVKKKPEHDEDSHTPSWGVALEGPERDDNPASLAAPMYKSENPPNSMQETDPDTQNPRPIRSSTSVHSREEFSSSQNTSGSETGDHTQKMSLAEAVTEKLAPDYATISDASQLTRISSAKRLMCISKPLTVTPSNEDDTDLVEDMVESYGVYEEKGLEKGVSVREYIQNKLEPGEDERALCKVISEAISPIMLPGEKGVMEKVREVVTSLIQAEEEQGERQEEERRKQQQRKQQQQQEAQQMVAPSTRWRSSSPSSQIPLSTNAYEGEEENHGRTLQAN